VRKSHNYAKLHAKQTLHGPLIDEPLARDGQFFTPNQVGSTTTLTDITGAVQQSYSYSPFGETTGSGMVANPFQFTGRENDGTGLMYYRSRYYAPAWGRFVSEDPIGLGSGPNQYAYANNNPVMSADPDGRVVPLVVAGAILLVFLASERPADVVPPGYKHHNVYLEISDFLDEKSQFGCGSLMSSFNPGDAGFIDPRLLQAGRPVLDGDKVLNSWRLRQSGSHPPPIEINRDGVTYEGNSRARVGAMRGEEVPYRVVDRPMPGAGPVLERPMFWRSGKPASVPWEPRPGFWEGVRGFFGAIRRFFRP
jgi:RHS repeat-associated protein